jgi:hypothetical protein
MEQTTTSNALAREIEFPAPNPRSYKARWTCSAFLPNPNSPPPPFSQVPAGSAFLRNPYAKRRRENLNSPLSFLAIATRLLLSFISPPTQHRRRPQLSPTAQLPCSAFSPSPRACSACLPSPEASCSASSLPQPRQRPLLSRAAQLRCSASPTPPVRLLSFLAIARRLLLSMFFAQPNSATATARGRREAYAFQIRKSDLPFTSRSDVKGIHNPQFAGPLCASVPWLVRIPRFTKPSGGSKK